MSKPLDALDLMALQNQTDKQAQIRSFDTHAPIAGSVDVNPLRMQLIAHFDSLTTAYAQRVAVDQLASLARLCKNCKE